MTKRRTVSFSIFAAAILALCLPVLASAQGGYGYPDYGRNRNGNNGRYDERYLKDSINQLDRLAKELRRRRKRERGRIRPQLVREDFRGEDQAWAHPERPHLPDNACAPRPVARYTP